MEWEQIDKQHQRAKVVGGWLVKAFENVWFPEIGAGYDWRVAMAFVPDPNHEWDISTSTGD